MQDWGSGYITDIEYLGAFYTDQSPRRMALAATIGGIEAPDFSGDFTYCELGCGRGVTSTILAAVHPRAQFHAIDFNPAHIAYARQHARAAGLQNITFHECSFADLPGPVGESMPMFDAITLHGIWSWISPELQDAILAFIDKRLNPGGLVYVGYNALPGWTPVAPIQRILRELAGETRARSDIAAKRAVGMLNRLAEAKVIPEAMAPALRRIQSAWASGEASYVAHEYLNEYWRPQFHIDVAGRFAGVKLTLAASTDLLRNFHNISMTAEQRELLAEIDSADLRETLKDFHDDTWFRRDVYVRGARRMSAQRRETAIAALELTLIRHPPESFHLDRQDGSKWHPEPLVYRPVLEALTTRPHRVSELLALPSIPAAYGISAVELVGILIGGNLAAVVTQPTPEALDASGRLNGLVDFKDPGGLSRKTVVAAPALGVGFGLSAVDLALYDDLRRGRAPDPVDLARRFIAFCREEETPLIVDDKVIEDPQEAERVMSADYVTRIERLTPLWSHMGLIWPAGGAA